MKKYDELWHSINNLLSYLRSFDVVGKTNDYYLKKYNNNAPGEVIKKQIDELQKQLDNAKEE